MLADPWSQDIDQVMHVLVSDDRIFKIIDKKECLGLAKCRVEHGHVASGRTHQEKVDLIRVNSPLS